LVGRAAVVGTQAAEQNQGVHRSILRAHWHFHACNVSHDTIAACTGNRVDEAKDQCGYLYLAGYYRHNSGSAM
jgi:hypothetical protein